MRPRGISSAADLAAWHAIAPANRRESGASKRSTAYHEAGHAVVAYYRREGGAPVYATLHEDELAAYNRNRRPERHALGYMQTSRTLPRVVRGSVDHAAVRAALAAMLGGLAADLARRDRPLMPFASLRRTRRWTGAGGDLENAIDLADRALVAPLDSLVRAARDEVAETGQPPEEIARRLHRAYLAEHVYPMLDAALADAHGIVTAHWPAVRRVARALLERGRLDAEQIAALIEGEHL